jgi:hypothetical protein
VVAGNAQRRAGLDHRLHEPHAVDDPWATVNEVADEDRLAPLGVRVCAVGSALVAELGEQLLELVVAAVNVADDVERPALLLAVVPERRARDRRRLDLLRRAEHVHLPEALLAEPAQRAAELARLVADHVRAEVAVGPAAVAVLTEPLRQVEDDCDRQEVVLARERDERRAVLALDVGRVDDREPTGLHSLGGDVVEELEGRLGRRLVILVVGDEAAAEVGREHLRRQEVRARERRLARAGGADEQHQRQLGHLECARLGDAGLLGHRSKTAICVGAPTSWSSGPTGRKRTP